jgi:GTP cyclohydrolase I
MTESAEDRATSIGSSHLQTDPEDDVRWEAVRPRSLSLAQWDRFEGYVREIFEALGMDLETPGTKDTPSRFPRRVPAAEVETAETELVVALD